MSVRAFAGRLGWGRGRIGLEIYGMEGRLSSFEVASVDHLENAGSHEGQAVIIIVLPGRAQPLPPDYLLRGVERWFERLEQNIVDFANEAGADPAEGSE